MNRRLLISLLGLAALVLWFLPADSRPSLAWQDEGHVMVNQVAAEHLPEEVPAFFREAVDRLAYLGPEPDRFSSARP
jgi:hypothetical protein